MTVQMTAAELARHVRSYRQDASKGDALIQPADKATEAANGSGWALYVTRNHYDLLIPVVVVG